MRQIQTRTEAYFEHLPIGRCEGTATLTLEAWPPQNPVHEAGKNVTPIPAHGHCLAYTPAAREDSTLFWGPILAALRSMELILVLTLMPGALQHLPAALAWPEGVEPQPTQRFFPERASLCVQLALGHGSHFIE